MPRKLLVGMAWSTSVQAAIIPLSKETDRTARSVITLLGIIQAIDEAPNFFNLACVAVQKSTPCLHGLPYQAIFSHFVGQASLTSQLSEPNFDFCNSH